MTLKDTMNKRGEQKGTLLAPCRRGVGDGMFVFLIIYWLSVAHSPASLSRKILPFLG